MTSYIRFRHQGEEKTGVLEGATIDVYQGDLFGDKHQTGERLEREAVTLLTPCMPSKVLGLWNNFHASAAKTGLPEPAHPWYFVMTPNSYAAGDTTIHKPASCEGKILFEGELGVVIGKRCKDVTVEDANDYVFGYTCVNDVTALEHLFCEKDFAHWTRAKSFDGFGIFGPTISTDVNPDNLVVKTFLEGDGQVQERQNYPVSDMFLSPAEIVSAISHDMTLEAGDLIACGTSLGAGAMKDGWRVRIRIDGVGELVNTYSDR